MEQLHLLITGSVDHGKSTLIGRLLVDTRSLTREKVAELERVSREFGEETAFAFVTDHLREEREQAKTIDTTQVFFKSRKRNYVIIDTPGPLEFIKNMITGTSVADAAVLIVDAKEGITEQTKRHAFLISLLGIDPLIVVCNKMDLVDYSQDRFKELKGGALEFLQRLGITPVYVIPISAKTGENVSDKSNALGWFDGPSLIKAVDALTISQKAGLKPLRLPIQDIYTAFSPALVVGRLASGSIRKGESVVILPPAEKATVREIKFFGRRGIKKAVAGESIGLILDNASVLRRGYVLAQTKDQPKLTQYFSGNVFWMGAQPLRIGVPFTLRCATQEVTCIAEKIEQRIDSSTLEVREAEARELALNEAGIVHFKSERPIVTERFSFIEELGRFAIEDESGLRGLGIIVS